MTKYRARPAPLRGPGRLLIAMTKNLHSLLSCCRTALFAGMVLFAGQGISQTLELWNIESLMSELSQVKHAKLDFKETKKSIFLIIDTTLEGNMEYRAPDYIEKNTLSPFLEKVVIDGDTMIIEAIPSTGKQENVVLVKTYSVESHPVLKAAVESIRAMLAGNYTALTENYEIALAGPRTTWELSLTPRKHAQSPRLGQLHPFASGRGHRAERPIGARPTD